MATENPIFIGFAALSLQAQQEYELRDVQKIEFGGADTIVWLDTDNGNTQRSG